MKNIIKVKSTEGYTIYNNDSNKTISAVIDENKEYEAKIYKPTLEYFACDSEGREFLVGEINIDGELVLEEGFYEVDKSEISIVDGCLEDYKVIGNIYEHKHLLEEV